MKNLKTGLVIATLCLTATNDMFAQKAEKPNDGNLITYDIKPDDPDEGPLAGNELSENATVLFPNPSYDKITVKFPYEANRKLQIFSLNGELQKSFIAKHERTDISLANLPPGNYILKVGSEIMRFTKQ